MDETGQRSTYLHLSIDRSIPRPTMCRTEEENVNGVDSAHVTAHSLPSKEGACRPLPLSPSPSRRPSPRPVTGARRVALLTLVCAAAAAIGAGRGCYGAFWWTASGSGTGEDGGGADLFNERLNISTSGAESRQRRSWRRPIEGVFRTVFGVGRDGKRKEWQQQQQRLAAEVEDEHSRAMEQETPPAKKNAKRTRKGDSHETSRRTKWKRKALRKWWRRVLEKAGVGGSKKVKRDGLAEAKARLVEELRKRLEQHPEELRIRAKAVLHELDDGMLLRYLEMAFWTMETGGKPLTEAIGDSVRWREEVGPHRVTEGEVIEEAEHGKLYVRGHDREGRPIIHYSPGLEISFDTEKGLKLLFYTLERARTMLPRGQTQFAVIVDCRGFGPSKTPPLAMLKTAFRAMQKHYPMRLGYVVMVNSGGPVALVWKIISAVLDDRTKDKISFLTKKEAPARLARHVDPSYLPSSLPGGLDPFRYSNKAYLLA